MLEALPEQLANVIVIEAVVDHFAAAPPPDYVVLFEQRQLMTDGGDFHVEQHR